MAEIKAGTAPKPKPPSGSKLKGGGKGDGKTAPTSKIKGGKPC